MKSIHYTKYKGDLASEMDLEDLLQALSDYLLDSGFRDPYSDFEEMDRNLETLRELLRYVLENGDFFDDSMRQKLDELSAEGKLDELIDKLIERMEQENFISLRGPQGSMQNPQAGGQAGGLEGEARFEVTDKSLDFLGYKTLRDLLGSLGKSTWAGTTQTTPQPESRQAVRHAAMNLATC